MKSITELAKIAGAEVKEKEPLAKWTTFKIGGPAKYFVVIRSIEKLGAVLNFCREKKMPYIILGGGSNLLIGEKGFAGLAIRLMADNFLVTENKITVDAGMSLTRLVGLTAQCSLSGLEWAAGIPGTVGGAVHGNAGAYGGSMSQCVNAVTIWRDGKIVKLNKEDCHFIYRGSIFKATHNKDVILSAELVLNLGEEKTIRAKMMEIINKRRAKFVNINSAGSTFKNIEMTEAEILEFKKKYPDLPDEFVKYRKIPAAWLIDQCDLRGKTIGGAQVYENHAGIVINIGQATAESVIMLISVIKQKVRMEFGLQLHEEIEYIG